MNRVLLQEAIKLNKERKRKKVWQNAVRFLAAGVVFCTTYALILPAITMNRDPICGMEAHEHEDSCYGQQQKVVYQCQFGSHVHDDVCRDASGNLICGYGEMIIHSHNEFCYDGDVLVCGLNEVTEHIHDGNCYARNSELACTIPEAPAHVHDETSQTAEAEPVLVCQRQEGEIHAHTEDCYTWVQQLVCGLTEEEGHTHEDACFQMLEELACGMSDTEAHVHGDGCYQIPEQTCPVAETEGHVHTEECYQSVEGLVCQKPQAAVHTHDESCRNESGELACGIIQGVVHNHAEGCAVHTDEADQILVCGMEEHIHEDDCYPEDPEAETGSPYLCGMGIHAHGPDCYDENDVLMCSIPEHSHEAACLVEELDMTADVETREQWEAELSALNYTGVWAEDVLTVAKSQLGYQESRKNVILDENGVLRGYTRYGEWYGDHYGDWCAMFVSFCLDYAGVEDFPLEASCPNWIELLKEQELYRVAGEYAPKPGDVIFFDWDQPAGTVSSDHVGIVADLIPGTEDAPAQIRTIEGNSTEQVEYNTYNADDVTIIGYGELPVGENRMLIHEGTDYTVTVRFGSDAGIPENAVLAVREIEPGTEEFDSYYNQSVEAMTSQGVAEELDISFVRFFDISFQVDGVTVEPVGMVDVQVNYLDPVAMAEDKDGVAVHFAQEGVEILDAQVSSSSEDQEGVDTFAFSQNSFSVVGTVVSNYSRGIENKTATRTTLGEVDTTGGTLYVIYTQVGGQYYAITSKAGDVVGYSVPVTVSNNRTVTWTVDDPSIFWSFTRNGNTDNSYYVQNYSTARYLHAFDNSSGNKVDRGTMTSGRNPSTLVTANQGRFTAQGNGYYTGVANTNSGNVTFNRVSGVNSAAKFYVAEVGSFYNVWFDGTNGGMMSYYGAANTNHLVSKNNDGTATTIELPETWQSSTKYEYVLQGWYDIINNVYYPVDPNDDEVVTAEISADTVFYADWIAATYDVGEDNADAIESLDTSDFITTHVFDYNSLFNLQSLDLASNNISASSHSETWELVRNGNVDYSNERTLDFIFLDYDNTGEFVYPSGNDDWNVNHSADITEGIIENVKQVSGGKNLMDILFDPNTPSIGKLHVGTGNYLFQYMDSTTPNYDGEHDGYYYLDSRLNAASYNQSEERFYLYSYLERTSDSRKDPGIGQYSDFLPFNAPHMFDEYQVDVYAAPLAKTVYEYDAKDGGTNYPEFNSLDDATTNYFFGIRSDIEFFLPNDTGYHDEYGNYGNISTRDEHMVFEFHGDDDLWVFIDGKLVLDVGGMHGIMYGEIDFSTGTVTSGRDGGEVKSDPLYINEGTHTMTVYYMERGSSQSNCAIYFNIAPRYDLEITKEDVFTAELLDGAEFTIYTCEDCAYGRHAGAPHVAELWTSQEAHEDDMDDGKINDAVSTIVTEGGKAYCWGLSAGKTYYIKETKSPQVDGVQYPKPDVNDDVIRITLNNRGTATIETTTLHGPNGEITEGYAVIKQSVDNTLKIVSLTVTNQRNQDTTQIRVSKVWDANATDLPNSITAYLTVNGERVGREAVLSEANGWTYTWTGLPVYGTDGAPIEYVVGEIQVPGFSSSNSLPTTVTNRVEWVKTEHMEDNAVYILLNSDEALAYNGRFYWMNSNDAQDANKGADAQWTVTTNQYGFRLTNGSGYALTYDPKGHEFYGITDTQASLNQVIYYLENRLVAHDHDVYYQMGMNGAAVAQDGLVFNLMRRDVINGTVVTITNTLVDNNKQTFLEVNKVWMDDADHREDSVTIHLLANGEDTGLSVVLNDSNSWSAVFDGLPYEDEKGEPIVYTVLEDEPKDYDAEYIYGTLPGKPVVTWVKQSALTKDENLRIVSGASAMATDSSGNLIIAVNDPNDQFQWWTPVDTGRGFVLKNVKSGAYLRLDGTTVTTTTSRNSATPVDLNDGVLTLDGAYYLQMGKTSFSVSVYKYNATVFNVSKRTEGTGQSGVSATVQNSEEVGFVLPNTGGSGMMIYAFGSLLITAAAIMYICESRHKRRKGGV